MQPEALEIEDIILLRQIALIWLLLCTQNTQYFKLKMPTWKTILWL